MTDTNTNSPNSPATDRTDFRNIALFAFAVLGLLFSTMLLVDYTHAPVFCDQGGGCEAVKHSVYAKPLGVPLPVLGVAFYATVIALASMTTHTTRKLLTFAGGIGLVSGIGFLFIQAFVLHTFCKLCLVVDASAISVGICALSLWRNAPAPMAGSVRVSGIALAACALAGPVVFGWMHAVPHRPVNQPVIEPMPAVIAHEQAPGIATVVEFVDFECPFCRRQQEALAPVLASYGSRVRLVRRNVPLPFHTHARDAARASCCAEEQGRGEHMAAALFSAEDLTIEGCNRIAQSTGIDMATYRTCLASTRPDVRIERDHNDAREARVGGLPTLWIGNEKFEGLTSPDALRQSIDRAIRAAGTSVTPATRSGT
jgi:protein-disulfide isomerase